MRLRLNHRVSFVYLYRFILLIYCSGSYINGNVLAVCDLLQRLQLPDILTAELAELARLEELYAQHLASLSQQKATKLYSKGVRSDPTTLLSTGPRDIRGPTSILVGNTRHKAGSSFLQRGLSFDIVSTQDVLRRDVIEELEEPPPLAPLTQQGRRPMLKGTKTTRLKIKNKKISKTGGESSIESFFLHKNKKRNKSTAHQVVSSEENDTSGCDNSTSDDDVFENVSDRCCLEGKSKNISDKNTDKSKSIGIIDTKRVFNSDSSCNTKQSTKECYVGVVVQSPAMCDSTPCSKTDTTTPLFPLKSIRSQKRSLQNSLYCVNNKYKKKKIVRYK